MDKGDHKKISFGFSKLSRKTNLIQKPVLESKKIELIDCVEDQSIKIVGGEESKEIAPLVIPMRNPNKKLLNLEAIVKNDFKDDFEDDKPIVKTEEVTEELKPDENLSLDELAARELLKDLKNGQVKKEVIKVISVPVTEKVVFEGEKESTLEDYDDIPVKDFGLAVLRGMGWKDGEGIGKNSKVVKTTQPNLRPKGMGLGADRIAKQNVDAKPAVDKEGKVLACVKGAYIKIIAGYHKGFYGQIIGFDEESGRFIIKTALNNLNLSLNEFLVTPVTRDEYNKNSKVINNEKYEEYIKNKNIKKEKSRSSRSPEGPRIPETAIKKENNHKDLSDEEKNQNDEDTKVIPDVDIKTEISSPDKEDEIKHQQNSPNQSDHNSSSRNHTADRRSDSYSKSERPSYPNNRESTDRGRSSKQQESSDNNRNRRHRSVSREKYNRYSERSDNRRESRDGSNDRRYDRTNRNVDGSDNRQRHLSRDDSERRMEGRSRAEQSRRNKYEDSHNEAANTKYGDRSDSRQSRTCRKSKNPDKKTRDRTESESDSDDGSNTPVVASGSRHSDKSVHRTHKHLDDSDGDSKHSSKHSKQRNTDKARKNRNSDSSDELSGDDSKKKKRKSKRKHSMSDSSDDDSDDSSSSEDRKKHRKRKSKKNASDSSGDEKQKKCKKRDRSKTRKHKNKKKEKHRKRN